jgi:hypothetical protein
MNLEELKNKTFGSGLLGYNKAEVDIYLKELADYHENLLSQHASEVSRLKEEQQLRYLSKEQGLQEQLTQLQKELDEVKKNHRMVVEGYENQLERLRQGIPEQEESSDDEEEFEDDLNLGANYAYLNAMAVHSVSDALAILRLFGWTDGDKPSLHKLRSTINAIFYALSGAQNSVADYLDARDYTWMEATGAISDFAALENPPHNTRLGEVVYEQTRGENRETFVKKLILINSIFVLNFIAKDNISDEEWQPVENAIDDKIDALADVPNAKRYFSTDEILEKAPLAYALTFRMIVDLTEEQFDLETLDANQILSVVIPWLVPGIIDEDEKGRFDQLELSEEDGATIVKEAMALYGPVLGGFVVQTIGASYLEAGSARVLQHLMFTILYSKAYDLIEEDSEGKIEENNALLHEMDTLAITINYNEHESAASHMMKHMGLYMALMHVSGYEEDLIEMGKSVGLIDGAELDPAVGTSESGTALFEEFPTLSVDEKDQLIDELNTFIEKLNTGSSYNPYKDKDYGKNPNERQMYLLKLEISAFMNDIDVKFGKLSLKEKLVSYVLMKIKVKMRRDDPLRSPLRSLDNKLYGRRRKDDEPMSDDYYLEVSEFVDTNYPEHSDLIHDIVVIDESKL